jgi:hypothetical protein
MRRRGGTSRRCDDDEVALCSSPFVLVASFVRSYRMRRVGAILHARRASTFLRVYLPARTPKDVEYTVGSL